MGEFGMVSQLNGVIINSLVYDYGGILSGIGVGEWGERKKGGEQEVCGEGDM